MLHFKWIAPTAVAVGMLAACGGGGGDGPVADQFVAGTTEVPVGVETRVDDVVAFSKAQIANTSDSRDPVVLADTKLATSESDDPADI
ncbi:hypothetical protein [Rhodoferax sp. WC2427]|uniref:hypothetical protein n=1 Tax=Rhodoferax sp. WC2427 TaxID=3234144 RepID=UPI0034671882